jgi:hypothetical protein
MRKLIGISFLGVLSASCSKPLELPDTQPDTSIVVVEGDIVTGNNMNNTVLLSRVRSLSDTNASPISQAQVQIVDEGGQIYGLSESSDTLGKYRAILTLDQSKKYALRIVSPEGNTYESVYQVSKACPPIDSLTYLQPTPQDNFTVYVHTHDPNNNTRYYRWEGIETWERHSFYESYYKYVNGQIVFKPLTQQDYACWRTEPLSNIILANTSTLAQDVVSYQPLTIITKDSEKGDVRYSILVKQIALTREAYDFWSIIKKNTELTGSLFDPQPSQYSTNISCKNNPKKKAIGFISVSGSYEARLFVNNSWLQSWPHYFGDPCTALEFSEQGALAYLAVNPDYDVAYYINFGGGFGLSRKTCIDCTLTGGTKIKPLFW